MYKYIYIPLAILFVSCSDSSEKSISDNNLKEDTTEEPISDSLVEIEGFVQLDSSIETGKEITYYPTGEIEQIIEYNESSSGFKYTEFYKNGKRKVAGEQGEISGCGIAIGDELYFDSTETLTQKVIYDHFLPEPESCHEIRTVKTIIDYYKNGKIKKTGTIETCYECVECPCGKWQFHDINGKVIRTETYGDCYDSNLECEE